ncbi:MAG: glycosyltransferase [Anaerolineales bacterium]|nr:glycosyltransferase [Anaerolineales bacterium]
MADRFPGRVGLQQRILPSYRAPFFDLLAGACEGGLSVFAGQATPREGVNAAAGLRAAQHHPAKNHHFRTPGDRWYFCWQSGLLDWLSEWDPEILIMEANPRYLSSPRGLRWMRRRNRPVIGWGLGAPAGRGALEGARLRRQVQFLRQFEALVTYSGQGAEEFKSLGIDPARIFVAPNAVAPRPKETVMRPLPGDGRPLNVLFVGRLVERKQVDRLILACELLPRSLQPRLVVVGDGPARPELETLARSHYPNTTFAGAVHGPELSQHYVSADLFVLPGTGGLAIQEAMSFGLPVIVGRGDGTQTDLVRPENGWNAAGGSPQDLANTLQLALEDPHRLRRMGAESYRIVHEEINLEEMVRVFVRVLNEFAPR